MSDTRQVRELLTEALLSLRRATRCIRNAEAHTYREKSGLPRAPRTATKMTPALAAKLVAYKKAHPDASHQEIGVKFGVHGGRVSEQLIKAKKNGARP